MLELAPVISTALEEMYRDYHGMVFRTAYRVTGSAEDAEDVLQTVFMRLVRRNAAGEIDNAESYLRRSAVNAAVDLVRARRQMADVELERLPAFSSGIDSAQLKDQLRKGLAALPGRSAEMFVLRFIEGLSNGEVAKQMGISAVTVAVTLHRTRKKLQQILRQGVSR